MLYLCMSKVQQLNTQFLPLLISVCHSYRNLKVKLLHLVREHYTKQLSQLSIDKTKLIRVINIADRH